MAKNRKNQSAAIHFGPVVKVVLLCFLFGGSAVGYVWEKNEINRLARQISEHEKNLNQLQDDNERLASQLAVLHSPVMIDARARQLNLGLAPAQPMQVVRLNDAPAEDKMQPRQFAGRPTVALTP
ncbi:MAG TPA: septum formation initiator family protein [Verrucomicrobiae bacterium]|jgi:cell division protein FtsB